MQLDCSGFHSKVRLVILPAAVLEPVVRLVPEPALVLAGRIVQRVPVRALVVALALQDEIPAVAHAVREFAGNGKEVET